MPLADPKFTSKILETIHQALKYKQVRKGVNETLKFLNKGIVECVILAADTEPLELLATIPGMCEERNVPYCFVSDKGSLGRACGISRPVVCCCLVGSENSGM